MNEGSIRIAITTVSWLSHPNRLALITISGAVLFFLGNMLLLLRLKEIGGSDGVGVHQTISVYNNYHGDNNSDGGYGWAAQKYVGHHDAAFQYTNGSSAPSTSGKYKKRMRSNAIYSVGSSNNKFLSCDGHAVDFAKDGSWYKKCVLDYPSSVEDRTDVHYGAHHYSLPKTHVLLLNQRIGYVTRICEGGGITLDTNNKNDQNHDDDTRCVLPTGNEISNINSPMPIRTNASWMTHPAFQGTSVIVYYSSHNDDAIRTLVLDSSNTEWRWREVQNYTLKFRPKICRSLHSPSIFVDEDKERFYM